MGTGSSLHDKKQESSAEKGSDEIIEFFCDPCHKVNEQVEATGYCTDCKEYLCRVCFKSHSRNKFSKNHTLLDRAAMPGIAVVMCDPCKTARDISEAKGYCADCKEFLCSDCYKSHSRNKLTIHHIMFDKDNMPGTGRPVNRARDTDAVGGNMYAEEYSLIKTLDVKVESDDQECYITGIALVSDTELVLTDESNRSVKLYDMENHFMRWLKMKSVPNRISTISHDQVAVVLRNECKIKIISIPERLNVIRTLKTDGFCVDVDYSNAKLFVSFRQPVKFQILQLTGVILKTIEPCSEILQYCASPSRIAVSTDESLIFVSDWKSNTYMSIDQDGNLKSTLSTDISHPCDVIISPFGQMYLCNRGKHLIYKMTLELSDVTVILARCDDIVSPTAMGLDVSKRRLYVSSGSSTAEHRNTIKVFKCA